MINKDNFWKFYSLPLIFLIFIALTDIKNFGVWEYILLFLEVISLMGYIFYLWDIYIFSGLFWIFIIVIYLTYIIAYEFFGLSDTYYDKINTTNSPIIFTILYFIIIYPKIIAMFNLIKAWGENKSD